MDSNHLIKVIKRADRIRLEQGTMSEMDPECSANTVSRTPAATVGEWVREFRLRRLERRHQLEEPSGGQTGWSALNPEAGDPHMGKE